ncbi:hypothetical protein OSTOST_24764, partial [Ostertagia ostertagi]
MAAFSMTKVHTGGFLMSSVYYCHQCRNQVPLRNTDMICGVCGGEFLEQITPPPRVIPHAPFSHFRQPPGRGAHFHHHHHHPPAQQPHVQQGSSQNAPEVCNFPVTRTKDIEMTFFSSILKHLSVLKCLQ